MNSRATATRPDAFLIGLPAREPASVGRTVRAALSGAAFVKPQRLPNLSISQTQRFSNPALTNPALTNPALTNPALPNPALPNPAVSPPSGSWR